MAFENTYKDVGRIKAGVKLEIHFPYDEEIASVGAISLSCGCSSAHHYPVNKDIVLVYKPQQVPEHMKPHGYTAQNYAIVDTVLTDGTTQQFRLTFQAAVY